MIFCKLLLKEFSAHVRKRVAALVKVEAGIQCNYGISGDIEASMVVAHRSASRRVGKLAVRAGYPALRTWT
jgi:hypothetical protein